MGEALARCRRDGLERYVLSVKDQNEDEGGVEGEREEGQSPKKALGDAVSLRSVYLRVHKISQETVSWWISYFQRKGG